MDDHMPDQDKTYRVLTGIFDNEKDAIRQYATSPYETYDRLLLNHPEIEDATRLIVEDGEIRVEDKAFDFSGLYGEANFFKFFNYKLVNGDNGALEKS